MSAIANLLTVIKGEAQLLARSVTTEGHVSRDSGRMRLSVIVAMVDQASVELQRLAPRQLQQAHRSRPGSLTGTVRRVIAPES
ncbi:MAG: hypothetical protein H0W06_12445 [Chloroflexia bacterium]|nr:hypothetical protein [Chloroflexia bacterium]